MALTPQEQKDLREAVPTWMRSGKGLAGDVDLSVNTLKSFNPPEGRIKRRGEDEEGEKVPYINRSPAGGNPPPPPPPCRGPSLLCDSSSNSKSKCRFHGYFSDKYYRGRVGRWVETGETACPTDITFTWENCIFTGCTGNLGSCACDNPDVEGDCPECITDNLLIPSGYGMAKGDGGDDTSGADSDTHFRVETDPGAATAYVDITLSDEYTTDQLKTDTIDGIPSYPGTYGGGCSAYRNLSDDEYSFSVTKLRYKFAFRVPSTNCFKMSWIERFTPEGGGGATDTAKSYTYDGSGMPGDHLETDVHDYGVPTTDGTTTIEQIWWTCQCDTDPTGEGTP